MVSLAVKGKCYWQQYVVAGIVGFLGTALEPMVAYAGVKSEINSIKNGTTGGAFKSTTSTVTKMGKSGVSLAKTILIVSALICVILCGVSFVVTKNAQKHEENKSWMLKIAIGCAMGFGATAIVTTLYSIGSGI